MRDIALAHELWTISPNGHSPSAHASHPTLALCRVEDDWKIAIAAPWGWAPARPLEAVL